MKIYELEIRIKDRFLAKNETEAKKEMVERLQHVLATDNDILWRLSCKEFYVQLNQRS